jgi:hypothetical protein
MWVHAGFDGHPRSATPAGEGMKKLGDETPKERTFVRDAFRMRSGCVRVRRVFGRWGAERLASRLKLPRTFPA